MPVFSKGSFAVDLQLASVDGEPDESDRQYAWELYCELVSRVALVGREDRHGEQIFVGEVLAEGLDSLHRFAIEARGLMRRSPVGRDGNRLGSFIAGLLSLAIDPFLDKWESSYRHWWHHQGHPVLSAFARQAAYPDLAQMQADWIRLRRFCREAAAELSRTYALPNTLDLSPPGLRQLWIDETRALCAGATPTDDQAPPR